MRRNTINTPVAAIFIQSCDDKSANICITAYGRSVYHHITLPSLEREKRPLYPSELGNAEYDAILKENRLRILARIDELNR